MGFHTFDVDRAANLEDPSRFRYCSREELLAALDPAGDERLADLGSGTGFYTRELAPFTARVDAVDVQPEMHDLLAEYGQPENVHPVTAAVGDLPFADGALDGAVSTMTFHEFASADALADVERALADGARFVVVDWSADGRGESGPPCDERYNAADAETFLTDAAIDVTRVEERAETFLVVGVA
jgi:SAM-dependent methyltransferase